MKKEKPKDKEKGIYIRCSHELWLAIAHGALKEGVTRSQLVIDILKKYLNPSN